MTLSAARGQCQDQGCVPADGAGSGSQDQGYVPAAGSLIRRPSYVGERMYGRTPELARKQVRSKGAF